ncbi:DDE superfamily endonuclease [Actinoplanes derwentensis]|uniref:DDE superfamily endonuclease n=1 Tax=Actinoplanes derwentensis TaxID=113562 RepID=A0A1H2DDB3_9ACTN|nr:hypothetical protein Ade03nite_85690 [Actinoplanes derwentensis]SDT80691.1 DDE superfamily endonuclease [Actinoplanes derwentensis]
MFSISSSRVGNTAVGRPVWASPAFSGAVHDLTAARTHGIIEALTSANVMIFADKGSQGACGNVCTPFKRRCLRPKLSRRLKAVNRAHARIRARDERAIATLKTWTILAKLRCCPRRATAMVQAILVLHHVEANRYAGWTVLSHPPRSSGRHRRSCCSGRGLGEGTTRSLHKSSATAVLSH